MTGLVAGLLFVGAFLAGAGVDDKSGKRMSGGILLIAIGLVLAYLMDVRVL